jgi:hypothetical protein
MPLQSFSAHYKITQAGSVGLSPLGQAGVPQLLLLIQCNLEIAASFYLLG